MEHGELGITQAGEYLLEVVKGQDRLRGDEMRTLALAAYGAMG